MRKTMKLRTQMMKPVAADKNDRTVGLPKEKALKTTRIKSTTLSSEKNAVVLPALIPRWKRGSRLS